MLSKGEESLPLDDRLLMLIQPWIVFALFVAMAHCWLMDSLLCTRNPKAFSAEPEVPDQAVPSLYHYEGFFLFEDLGYSC